MIRIRPVPSPALLALALAGALAACAPLQTSMSIPNPANLTGTLDARQTYEVGPFKENHRYEAGLLGWKPDSLRFIIHLANTDADCADPASFTITLRDEAGHTYPFVPAGQPLRTTAARGSNGATLHEYTLEGDFRVAVGPKTRAVVVLMRGKPGRCGRDIDFRWDFNG